MSIAHRAPLLVAMCTIFAAAGAIDPLFARRCGHDRRGADSLCAIASIAGSPPLEMLFDTGSRVTWVRRACLPMHDRNASETVPFSLEYADGATVRGSASTERVAFERYANGHFSYGPDRLDAFVGLTEDRSYGYGYFCGIIGAGSPLCPAEKDLVVGNVTIRAAWDRWLRARHYSVRVGDDAAPTPSDDALEVPIEAGSCAWSLRLVGLGSTGAANVRVERSAAVDTGTASLRASAADLDTIASTLAIEKWCAVDAECCASSAAGNASLFLDLDLAPGRAARVRVTACTFMAGAQPLGSADDRWILGLAPIDAIMRDGELAFLPSARRVRWTGAVWTVEDCPLCDGNVASRGSLAAHAFEIAWVVSGSCGGLALVLAVAFVVMRNRKERAVAKAHPPASTSECRDVVVVQPENPIV